MKTKRSVIPWGLSVLLCCGSASAQIFDTRPGKVGDIGTSRSSIGAYYNFGSETGLNITVSLWGYVRNPGRYVIPSGSNLIEFLSFGGGPTEGANLSEVKIIRKVVGPDSSFTERTYVYNVQQIMERTTADRTTRGSLPPILPGDTVIVEGSPPVQWMNVVSIIAQVIWAVTSIVSVIVTLTRK
jgi:hypothetical protein